MKLLGENIHAVNIGADIFADALKAQEIETQQLNWTPPIKRTLSALQVQMMDRLADDVAQKIDEANAKVVSNLKNTDPYWVGMKPAIEVVPDMHEGLILHAGPEIPWDEMCDAQQQGGINRRSVRGLRQDRRRSPRKAPQRRNRVPLRQRLPHCGTWFRHCYPFPDRQYCGRP